MTLTNKPDLLRVKVKHAICLHVHTHTHTHTWQTDWIIWTTKWWTARSSAVAEGPRDALCQLKSSKLCYTAVGRSFKVIGIANILYAIISLAIRGLYKRTYLSCTFPKILHVLHLQKTW